MSFNRSTDLCPCCGAVVPEGEDCPVCHPKLSEYEKAIKTMAEHDRAVSEKISMDILNKARRTNYEQKR